MAVSSTVLTFDRERVGLRSGPGSPDGMLFAYATVTGNATGGTATVSVAPTRTQAGRRIYRIQDIIAVAAGVHGNVSLRTRFALTGSNIEVPRESHTNAAGATVYVCRRVDRLWRVSEATTTMVDVVFATNTDTVVYELFVLAYYYENVVPVMHPWVS